MDELNVMYQVSTLQALSMGYTRSVIRVKELLGHGNTGLGTFEDVNGEMILLDGHCYRADADGFVSTVPENTGVPFASVTFLQEERRESLPPMSDIGELKSWLDVRIEEDFGLNSMHMVRIDGSFAEVRARSEEPGKDPERFPFPRHPRDAGLCVLSALYGRDQRFRLAPAFCFCGPSARRACISAGTHGRDRGDR